MRIYAVAFRHKVAGEGVAGVEWDITQGAAQKRLEGLFQDPDYETAERTFDVEGLDHNWSKYTRDLVTDAIDEHFFADFGGRYDDPVPLTGDWVGPTN